MIHRQDHGTLYAYCHCGVCSPPRRSRAAALADDRAHTSVCSTRKAT
jgi:hypothetical protein